MLYICSKPEWCDQHEYEPAVLLCNDAIYMYSQNNQMDFLHLLNIYFSGVNNIFFNLN